MIPQTSAFDRRFPASSRVAGWPCQLRARFVTRIRTPAAVRDIARRLAAVTAGSRTTAAPAIRGGRLRYPETPCSGNHVVMSRHSLAIIEARVGRSGAVFRPRSALRGRSAASWAESWIIHHRDRPPVPLFGDRHLQLGDVASEVLVVPLVVELPAAPGHPVTAVLDPANQSLVGRHDVLH